MNSLRLTAGILALLATVCMILVQFLPWASQSMDGFGASSKTSAYTWEAQSKGSAFGFSGSDSTGWYSGDWDDADDEQRNAVAQLRIAIPLLLVGLIVVAIGALLFFVMGGSSAAIVTTVAALVCIAGTWLFAHGVDRLFSSDQGWAASFYLAIAASALALLGGVLGLVGGNRMAGA